MFIVVEGIDGSGKTSAVEFIADYLEEKGFSTYTVLEPGSTNLGKAVRKLFKDPAIGPNIDTVSAALLMNAARYELVKFIDQKLAVGHTVVSDRYALSTLAYQGTEAIIFDITRIGMQNRIPDLTIVLDIDPTLAMARFGDTHGDWVDSLALENKAMMRSTYLEYSQLPTLSQRTVIVDASQTLDVVQAALISALQSHPRLTLPLSK